ncbi:MAG: DsbA family protein [Chloroflexi bacterium]|nr:DsbA family protein [Chloroflexota bacterium]
MQEPVYVKPVEDTPPGSGASIFSLIVTAIVFFALGAFMAFIFQGSSDDDALPSSSVEIARAVEATFVALTPTATPLPTRVPTDQTLAEHNPFLGDEDAPIVMVEFSDYLCPYCARFHTETLEPLMAHYDGLVKFVYREYPIIGGQLSADISAAAQCAAIQDKYWEFTDLIWLNQISLERQQVTPELLEEYARTAEADVEEFNACIENGTGFNNVVVDYEAGRNYNINGTPGFFINGNRFTVGAAPLEVFIDAIDAELERMGITPPTGS